MDKVDMFSKYPDILTTYDVQSMLGLSKSSVLSLLQSEDIKSFRKGRKHIIPKVCVVEYVLAKIS